MSSSGRTSWRPGRPGGQRYVPLVLLAVGVLAVLLIVGGALLLLGQGSPAAGPPRDALIGRVLIPFPEMRTVDGARAERAPWHGHRGAVLLFFADWCAVCHREVPNLARAIGRGDVGGVRIVGLDGDASYGMARSFAAANHVRFPVEWDQGLQVADALVPAAFPAAVFVRGTGRVVAVDYGPLSIMQLSAGLSEIVHPSAAGGGAGT